MTVIAELVATPNLENIYMDEEQTRASDCIHCGWPVFYDVEPDWERPDPWGQPGYWQHNDDRYYTPGRPSVCPTTVWEDS